MPAMGRDDRRWISRELHDRAAQSILVAVQELELGEAYDDSDPDRARACRARAKAAARAAFDTVRDLAWTLRQPVADDGLEVELARFLGRATPPGVDARVQARGDESLIEAPVRDELFLVLREAAHNALAHAGAQHIRVVLSVRPDRVDAAVQDDGVGMDPRSAGHTGMSAMRERVCMLGGTFRVASPPQGGTRVDVLVPLAGSEK